MTRNPRDHREWTNKELEQDPEGYLAAHAIGTPQGRGRPGAKEARRRRPRALHRGFRGRRGEPRRRYRGVQGAQKRAGHNCCESSGPERSRSLEAPGKEHDLDGAPRA